jgi:hypothetical protein
VFTHRLGQRQASVVLAARVVEVRMMMMMMMMMMIMMIMIIVIRFMAASAHCLL